MPTSTAVASAAAGRSGATFNYWIFGGIVGANVIATRSAPRSYRIVPSRDETRHVLFRCEQRGAWWCYRCSRVSPVNCMPVGAQVAIY